MVFDVCLVFLVIDWILCQVVDRMVIWVEWGCWVFLDYLDVVVCQSQFGIV